MKTDLYWIPAPTPGRLAIMPRPRGGDWLEEEVRTWRLAGIDVIVSLLTSDEIAELDLAEEKRECEAQGIEFLMLSIVDRGIPKSKAALRELVDRLAKHLAGGQTVAIHCRQGIGRAALVAIGLLISLGTDVEAAIAAVSAARGVSVPETVEQTRWIRQFAAEPPVLQTQ